MFTYNQGTEGTTKPIIMTKSVPPTESDLTVSSTSTIDTGQFSDNIKTITSKRSRFSNLVLVFTFISGTTRLRIRCTLLVSYLELMFVVGVSFIASTDILTNPGVDLISTTFSIKCVAGRAG